MIINNEEERTILSPKEKVQKIVEEKQELEKKLKVSEFRLNQKERELERCREVITDMSQQIFEMKNEIRDYKYEFEYGE